MKKITTLLLMLFAISQLSAQEISQTEKIGFLIIHASKNYELAKRVATEAHKHLGYKIDFRGLEYNKTLGLSISKKECEENGFEYPAYVQRGRGKDGNFISVEYTTNYEGFTPGLYIVVVASYSKGKNEISETLKFVKKHYETAYFKYIDVYVGCIH
ncbi:MAG: hypothetical protein B6I20_04970 [Bacteroidetes bacterium 4572_117]|nr:MAG: hypothetical protein B6I20_04970 [Bacteroidetes bacterium 4572_117]